MAQTTPNGSARPKRKRSAKAKKAQAATPMAAQPKANGAIDESTLTKGEVRKLNALRKSVGPNLGDQTFRKWLKTRSAKATDSEPGDKNADLISDALMKLIDAQQLRIPRGGYLVTRGHGRVIVEQPEYV